MMTYQRIHTKFSKSAIMRKHNDETTGFRRMSMEYYFKTSHRFLLFILICDEFYSTWMLTLPNGVSDFGPQENRKFTVVPNQLQDHTRKFLHTTITLTQGLNGSLPFIVLHRRLPLEQQFVVLHTHSKVTFLIYWSQSPPPHTFTCTETQNVCNAIQYGRFACRCIPPQNLNIQSSSKVVVGSHISVPAPTLTKL
jgi:hypothetical protein